jgi:hypothetical protein
MRRQEDSHASSSGGTSATFARTNRAHRATTALRNRAETSRMAFDPAETATTC